MFERSKKSKEKHPKAELFPDKNSPKWHQKRKSLNGPVSGPEQKHENWFAIAVHSVNFWY